MLLWSVGGLGLQETQVDQQVVHVGPPVSEAWREWVGDPNMGNPKDT